MADAKPPAALVEMFMTMIKRRYKPCTAIVLTAEGTLRHYQGHKGDTMQELLDAMEVQFGTCWLAYMTGLGLPSRALDSLEHAWQKRENYFAALATEK